MIVVVMGVTGSGKTTVGSLLAKPLGWEFADADNFHSPANVEKMKQGIALRDADRAPWLASLREAIRQWIVLGKDVVLACSALKKDYRNQLSVSSEVKFVYLKGSYDLIDQRLGLRHGHFATDTILAGQFADLEEPDDAITVEIDQSPEAIVAEIRRKLGVDHDHMAPKSVTR
jgi:gluconokinase